ncbi:MAG: type II secretion system protein J [Vulcanimicrobiota bacterium]
MTLIETLISMALLSLVLLATYSALTLALRFQSRVHDSVTTFQQAAAASARIQQALGLGSAASLSIEAPTGFAFASAAAEAGPFTHDSNGDLEFHRWVFFYIDGGDLWMGEVPFAATTTLSPTPTLANLRADGSARLRRVAQGVTEMEVFGGSGAEVRLRVEGQIPERKNAVTIRNRVTFRQ